MTTLLAALIAALDWQPLVNGVGTLFSGVGGALTVWVLVKQRKNDTLTTQAKTAADEAVTAARKAAATTAVLKPKVEQVYKAVNGAGEGASGGPGLTAMAERTVQWQEQHARDIGGRLDAIDERLNQQDQKLEAIQKNTAAWQDNQKRESEERHEKLNKDNAAFLKRLEAIEEEAKHQKPADPPA